MGEGSRLQIAIGVLVLAGLGIAVFGGVFVVRDAEDGAEKAFNALLPVLATWVGTVLAFYFSKDNFEAANRNVRDLVKLTLDERLGKLGVSEEMMPIEKAKSVSIPEGGTERDILVSELRQMFDDRITRIPILSSDGRCLYVVHSSMVFKYMADHLGRAPEGAEGAGEGAGLADATLADFLADPGIKKRVTSIAWVATSATLAEAKKAMESVAGCQDVFVTQNGKHSEPVVGWLTNTRISRLAEA